MHEAAVFVWYERGRAPMNSIPRSAVVWLIASVCFSILPILNAVSFFWWPVLFFVVLWRWMLHQGKWPYPNVYVRTVVVLAGIALTLLESKGSFNLESASAFLLAATLAKSLELKVRRDAYVLIFVCVYDLVVGFLFEQQPVDVLYAIFATFIILESLLKLQGADQQSAFSGIQSDIKFVVSMLLISLPVMLFIFVLFPRLDPLWSFTLHSDKARTGFTDEIDVGDIAELSQSSELAFTVSFDDKVMPERKDWYWRMLIVENYKDGKWKSLHKPRVEYANYDRDADAGDYEYTVIMEPHNKKWLPALRGVDAIQADTGETHQTNLVSADTVYTRLRYKAASNVVEPDHVNGINESERLRYTQIQADKNPKAQAFANKQRMNVDTDKEFVEYLLNQFKSGAYYYTLKPGKQDFHEVDYLMFDSKKGFCSHYAGAFVYLLRSVGIPARMVAGYQGGKYIESSNFISVRQFDAHAWTEVWLPDLGWQRYDPTAYVSPDRIEFGLEQAVADEETFLQGQMFSFHGTNVFSGFKKLNEFMAEVNYQWQEWVLSYDKNKQSESLLKIFGANFKSEALTWLASGFAISLFLLGVLILWRPFSKVKRTPLEKALIKLDVVLTPVNLNRREGEGLSTFFHRLSTVLGQADSVSFDVGDLLEVSKLIESYYYLPDVHQADGDKQMLSKEIVRRLNRVSMQLSKQVKILKK